MKHLFLIVAMYLGACATQLPQKPALIGMTPVQVVTQTNWGHPTYINNTITKYGSTEQWVYRNAIGRHQYLYFSGGRLVAIQN